MSDPAPEPPIVNVEDTPEIGRLSGAAWGAAMKPLTPSMRPRGGKLGVNWIRLPPGRATVPFHAHRLEDEAFFILRGRAVLRLGEELTEVRAGDCVSCPAGTGEAHQLGNPFDEDCVYLAIGNHEPEEVCFYPDTGKVLVRGLGAIGRVSPTAYMDGEPEIPGVLARWAARGGP